ncbi:MAG: SpoIIE family protein phosphatase, partial [Deltaproteobacteria bacterium]|nr:SpoIIE family protein phosphatase [Deltaproteobacteria bacterium]
MEQQLFNVKFSVTTKLLLSVVLLLIVIILFLNLSTLHLVSEDKRAYVYQSQSTEALLISREFLSRVKRSVDTLRLALGSFDPQKPIMPTHKANINAILNNQSDIAWLSIGFIQTDAPSVKVLVDSQKEGAMQEFEIQASDLKISDELLKVAHAQLLQHGFAFLNLSQIGKTPFLAILLADLKLQTQDGMPCAIGYISLKGFGVDAKSSNLTITDREGWVLFDNDPTHFFNKKNISDDSLWGIAVKSKLSTGAQEYTHQQIDYLGSYVLPGMDLITLSRIEKRKAMRATYALAERYLLLGLMATAGAIIFAILFAKTMTAPLSRLYQATKEVGAGNFNVDLNIKSKDEIGALSDSFVAMSRKIKELILESIRKVHLENELAIASTVQQTLIPPTKFENERIQISSLYRSADQCGGDWWGFFEAKDKLCLMIADATGHGLPSALITASARSCVSVLNKMAQVDPQFDFSPATMMSFANRAVHEAATGKIMMTFFMAVVDYNKKTLSYANAGHNPVWLFKNNAGKYAFQSLMSKGLRLGEGYDVPAYEEKTVPLSEGDVLFLYTDGILEG